MFSEPELGVRTFKSYYFFLSSSGAAYSGCSNAYFELWLALGLEFPSFYTHNCITPWKLSPEKREWMRTDGQCLSRWPLENPAWIPALNEPAVLTSWLSTNTVLRHFTGESRCLRTNHGIKTTAFVCIFETINHFALYSCCMYHFVFVSIAKSQQTPKNRVYRGKQLFFRLFYGFLAGNCADLRTGLSLSITLRKRTPQ